MSANIQSLIITYLLTLIVYGGMGIAAKWRLKKYTDKYDSDNSTVKGLQGWVMKWGGIVIFLIFWLPLINLLLVFSYTIKREIANHEVITITYWHVVDVIIYNWKIIGWFMVWIAIGLVRIIQGAANVFNLNWNIIHIEEVSNILHDSYFFSWNMSFIIMALGWTYLKADDKWPLLLRWAAYIGSVIIPTVICGNYVFVKSFPKLPQSDTMTYLWKQSIAKNTALNTVEGAGIRPAEYGISDAGNGANAAMEGSGSVATGPLGFPWLWWIIGVIALALIIFLFFKFRGKKSPTAAATGGEEKKAKQEGGTAASAGNERKEEERPGKKAYSQADYGNDLNLIRYDIKLFERYEKSPYWCLEKAPYQERVDRMRNYVFSLGAKARNDPFIPDDHEALTAEMQRLIMSDSLGRIPFDFSRVRVDYSDDAHAGWAGVVGEILSAASEGFFLLSGEYGNIIRGLGEQYMRSLADAANLTTERIRAANNTDPKSPDHQEIGRIKQRILNVQSWVGALQGAYSKTGYNVATPGMPQMQQGPSWVSVAYARNPKRFLITLGVMLLILILAIMWMFRGGGSSLPPEQEAYYKQELQTSMAEFVDYVCKGGDPKEVLNYNPSAKKGSKRLRAAVAAYETIQKSAQALDWDQAKTTSYYEEIKKQKCPSK